MESFHKDSDIVNIICVSSYFDLALLWVTFWQYEPQLSFFVLMDQGDKISWAETTQCTLYSQCIELSRLIQTKQGRLSKPSSTNCPGRQFEDTFEDAQWRKVKSHTNNAGALLKTLVTKLSTVGAFLPPTRLDCVQSSNNNLMTSRHTVCPSQKRNLKERKTYHNTISMSPN